MAKNKNLKLIGIIVGAVILVGIILFILFNSLSNADKFSKPSSKAICGNNILEKGETQENCCLDVPCDTFFVCKELQQNNQNINTCVKLKLEETKEYKDMLSAWLSINLESNDIYDITTNYDIRKTRVEQMNKAVTKLSNDYNMDIYKEFVDFIYSADNFSENINAIYNKLESVEDIDTQLELLNQTVTVNNTELTRLNNYTSDQTDLFNSIFNFDIIPIKEDIKSYIKLFQEQIPKSNVIKEMTPNPVVELSIIDYTPRCFEESGDCVLIVFKINIKNNGFFKLSNPNFDVSILKEGVIVNKDINAPFDLHSIPAQYNGSQSDYLIGYDRNDVNKGLLTLSEGQYVLKVDLRTGADQNIIATTSKVIAIQ